jgi:hypothetical protein
MLDELDKCRTPYIVGPSWHERYVASLAKEKKYQLNGREGYYMQTDDSNEGLLLLNTISDRDNMWNMLESMILFYEDVQRCNSPRQVTLSCLRMVKMVCHGSVIQKVLKSNYFKTVMATIEDEVQGSLGEGVDKFRNVIEFMAEFKKTDLYKKVYKLCMFVLTFSLFENCGLTFSTFGYNLFEEEAIRKKYYNRPKFLFALMDTLSFLMKKGLQIIQSGRIDAIFHSGDTYTKWFDDVQIIKRKSKLLCNPEAHGFNEFSYRQDLDSAIERGESIRIATEGNSLVEKRIVLSLLNEIKSIKCDLCTKSAARGRRTEPFSILISGGSGIGKSTLKDLLRLHFAKVENLDSDDIFCFTKNPTAKFWDGYTTSQWCVVLDDIAFMAPRIAPNGDPSCMEFLQIINPVPHCPDQAALEDKGRTPLKARLVIGTTNTENLNAHYYFACPSAAQRRFPYILSATPKAEYVNSDGMLDPSLTPAPIAGQYPNLWDFVVKKVQPRPHSMSRYQAETIILLEISDINEFIDWYTSAIQSFKIAQNAVEVSVKNMRSVPLCVSCYKICCVCEHATKFSNEGDYNSTVVPVIFCQVCSRYDCVCELQTAQIGLARFLQLIQSFAASIGNATLAVMAFCLFHDVVYFLVQMSVPIVSEWIFTVQSSFFNRFTTVILQRQRERVRLMGEWLRTRYNPAYAIAAFAMIYVIYNVSKLVQPELQGSTESVGHGPYMKDDERENVWYRNDFELSTYHLNPVITSSKGIDQAAFLKIVGRNVARASIRNTATDVNSFNMFCLSGSYYMTNNHHFEFLPGAHRLDVVFQVSKDGVTRNQQMFITEKQIFRYIEHDMVILHLPNIPPKKGLRQFLPDTLETCRNNGFYVTRTMEGELLPGIVNNIRVASSDRIPDFTGQLWGGTCDRITAKGDCGSPLFAKTGLGYILIGMHVLGNGLTYNVGATSISKQWVDEILPDLVIESGEPLMEAQTAKGIVGELHHKSVFRYLEQGSAEVYGSFIGNRGVGRSHVMLTPMAEPLSRRGYAIKYGPPVMKGYEPWRIAALECTQPNVRFDNDVINICTESFIQDILGSGIDLSSLHVYDNFTAINGAASIAYVEKINRNTSAGFPWRKSKKYFLKSAPPQFGLQDPVEANEEIMGRVDQMYNVYLEGKRVMPVFTAHLKDEATSFKKIKQKKTRVFAGAPFDWTILVRKFFLSSIRLIQNNRLVYESGPGTVAQSYEWHDIFTYLTTFGEDRLGAGDYKAFDKTMASIFILAAFRILITVAMKSGNFTSDDEKVMWGIAHDVAFPVMDFNGDFVQFFGSNPSGHPLTVIVNGLVNSLYFRYVYYMLNPAHEVKSFKSKVHLLTYGDDNVFGVCISAPWFNHTSIAAALLESGITYTMADKEAESVPYLHIRDVTFLKRSWRFDSDVGAYLAPIDHESLERSLMVWVRSKSISIQEQAISVFANVCREYFFYGKKTFNEKRQMLCDLVVLLEMEQWVQTSTFPTWNELYDLFWDNSKKVGCMPADSQGDKQIYNVNGYEDRSQPNSSFMRSYCTDQLSHSTKISERGRIELTPGRSPNLLFSDDGGVSSSVHVELCDDLSQSHSSKRLTNTNNFNEQIMKGEGNTLCDVSQASDLPLRNAQNAHTFYTFNSADCFDLQSLAAKVTPSSDTIVQEVVGFNDEVGGDDTAIPASINYVMSAGAVNAELGDYLSRPSEIFRFTWVEGSAVDTTCLPWELYFDQPAIQKKLDNYYLLQCNLKIKIVVNASPFYYGALLAAYQPLSLFNPAPIAATTGEEEMVLYSQRPHIDIYPQNCQGGELTLPFVYHREWLNITSRANLQDMGTLTFKSYTALLNANGVAGTDVEVVVFAWGEDVRLSGPTVKDSLQSKRVKDEYDGDGVISKPASAISKAAGSLADLPIIGPFMTATSAVSGTIGSIAHVLGFTNPPVLDDVHAFKSTSFPALATTDIGVPYEKLTLDAKNELSIDPKICGADLGDELLVKNFAQRESFLRSVTWSTTSVRTVPLFAMRVTPDLARLINVPGQRIMYRTPMAHLAALFQYWRGDIKIRIKVICTAYHKGRLRISFDPIGDIDTNLAADSMAKCYTHVMDIADQTDCTFNIPYVQDLAYLKVSSGVSGTYNNAAGTLTPTTNEGSTNGCLTISPLTVLTSPVTPSSVQLLVYVSAGDNFEVADPIGISLDYSYYSVQGDVSYTSAPDDTILIGNHTSTTDPNINLVYMGESVVSVRPMMHRGSLLCCMSDSSTVDNAYGVGTYYHVMSRRARFPGYDLDGTELAIGLVSLAPAPYNFVNWTAMTWFEPCFIGQRGSINWIAHAQQQASVRTTLSFNREHSVLNALTYYQYYQEPFTRSSVARGYIAQGARTMEGAASNSGGIQNTVHCIAPFYGNVKFQTTSANARNSGISADGSDFDAVRSTCVIDPFNVTANPTGDRTSSGFTTFYVSAGVDYNLIFFLNIPVTYKYTTVPSAV